MLVFGWFHKSKESELSKKGFYEALIRKTSPSGGGLHCNEAYVIIQNVDGLKKGVYHYNVRKHGLTYIGEWEEPLSELLCGQYFGDKAAIGIFVVAHLEKLWAKYPHSRGYRVALCDAGHLSQMFHLCARSLGLDSWLTGAFEDCAVSGLLKLEGAHHAPLLFLAAGYGSGDSLPAEFLE